MIGFMGTFVPLAITLVAAQVIAAGLGPAVYLAIESTVPISGEITAVTGPNDVADLLDATQISAQAAADLNAMFAQTFSPPVVYVATYDGSTEDPADALDRFEASQTVFGFTTPETRADAGLVAIAGWIAATPWRQWSVKAHLQTDEAGILTSGKPAGLAALEIPAVTLHWHSADAQPQAAAAAGLYSAYPMVERPTGLHFALRGITLPTVTNAQRVFARSNHAVVLQVLGAGVSSQTLQMDQTLQYSGDSMSAVYSLSYTLIRSVAALQQLVVRKSTAGEVLFATQVGAGEVRAALLAPLSALATAGYYVPGLIAGEPAPDGYSLDVTPSGSELRAAVVARLGQEATAIPFSLTGEVV